MARSFFVLICCCFFGVSVAWAAIASDPGPSMRICYVNFGVAPYGAYTRQEIEQHPLYKIWFYGNNRFNAELVSVLEAAPAGTVRVDPNMIRLLVYMNKPKEALYLVDEQGHVIEEKTGSMYKLDEAAKSALDSRITSYHGVVDQWPGQDVWGEDSEREYPAGNTRRPGEPTK